MTPPVPSHGRGGLGQAAMNPVKQVLQHFGEEIGGS